MKVSPRIKWLVENIDGKSILDIGFAGEEEPLVHMKIREKLTNSLIVGLDTNRNAVLKYHFSNTLVGDGSYLPFFEGSFECVILAEVLEHLYIPVTLFAEIRRILKPNGRLYVTTPNPYEMLSWMKHWMLARYPGDYLNTQHFLGSPDHRVLWEPLSLCHMLWDHGFTILSLTTRNHHLPYLGRIWKRLSLLDLSFYPFNRLGGYTCIIAVPKEQEHTILCRG